MSTVTGAPLPWYRTITREQWRVLLAAKLGWMLDAMDFMLYAMAIGQLRSYFNFNDATAGLLGTVRACRLPAAALREDWESWDAAVASLDRSPPHADLDVVGHHLEELDRLLCAERETLLERHRPKDTVILWPKGLNAEVERLRAKGHHITIISEAQFLRLTAKDRRKKRAGRSMVSP